MDIGSAFTFVFDDDEWIKKLAIGGGILLLATPLTLVIIGLLLLFPVMGYMIETLKNVRDGQATLLPEWQDFGGLFSTGWKVFVIGLVYNIPVILLSCASAGVNLGMQQMDSDVASALALVTICLNCVQFIFSLLAYALLPAGLIRLAQYNTLGAAFQFGELFSFIRNNIGDYIIVLLLGIVVGIVAAFGVILCIIGLFFTIFWSYLVNAHLYGQLARKANMSMAEL